MSVQATIEALYLICQSVLYVCVLYFMAGFDKSPGKSLLITLQCLHSAQIRVQQHAVHACLQAPSSHPHDCCKHAYIRHRRLPRNHHKSYICSYWCDHLSLKNLNEKYKSNRLRLLGCQSLHTPLLHCFSLHQSAFVSHCTHLHMMVSTEVCLSPCPLIPSGKCHVDDILRVTMHCCCARMCNQRFAHQVCFI